MFGSGFVLVMTCLVVICHIQKDSWSLDDQPLLIIDRHIKVITSLWMYIQLMLIFHKLLRPPALNDLPGRQGPSYPQTWRMSISLLPPCDSQPAPLAGQDPVGATWTGWTVPWGGGDLGETERIGWEEIGKTHTRVASWPISKTKKYPTSCLWAKWCCPTFHRMCNLTRVGQWSRCKGVTRINI